VPSASVSAEIASVCERLFAAAAAEDEYDDSIVLGYSLVVRQK
jgi:hypothetical protein